MAERKVHHFDGNNIEFSTNRGTPIVGWFVSWQMLLKWRSLGYPYDLGYHHIYKFSRGSLIRLLCRFKFSYMEIVQGQLHGKTGIFSAIPKIGYSLGERHGLKSYCSVELLCTCYIYHIRFPFVSLHSHRCVYVLYN